MTRSITNLTSIFTLAVVALFGSQVEADVYGRIDRSAQKIERKTKDLLKETIHYRATPQYLQLVGCTNELNRLAVHIHKVTHFEGNLVRLRADLQGLDTEFYLLQRLFDQVEEGAAYGRGQVIGNTAHVKSLLNSIEKCIHSIRGDVESLVAPPCPRTVVVPKPVVVAKPVIVTQPVLVPTRPTYQARPNYSTRGGGININISGRSNGNKYGNSRGRGYGGQGNRYGNSGFGISIGGGSSRISFGF